MHVQVITFRSSGNCCSMHELSFGAPWPPEKVPERGRPVCNGRRAHELAAAGARPGLPGLTLACLALPCAALRCPALCC
eukprot:8723290-Alexandrium_andersonii.AAC.1